jgi:probable HAF family extracellular repeat protein
MVFLRNWRFLVVPCGLAAALVAVSPALAAPPLYHVEVVPPLAGHDSVFPTDMSAEGEIAGVAGSDPFDPLATPVVYSEGILVALPKPTDSLNFALGIGGAQIVAGTSSGLPYVWLDALPVALPPAGGLPSGFANDAHPSGALCGAVINDLLGRQFPAFWSGPDAPGILLKGLRGQPDGAAFTFNLRGQIGGAAGGTAGEFFGARWDDPRRAPRKIGPLPGAFNSEVLGLNEHGDAVGRSSYQDGTIEAMLYVDATRELIGLGFLEGRFSFARAVNDARQVVGTATAGTVVHAFLWQDGVLHDLNDLVATTSEPIEYLANAVAIDAQGRIAAEAVIVSGFGTASRIAVLTPVAP